jgi:hypothetical protein
LAPIRGRNGVGCGDGVTTGRFLLVLLAVWILGTFLFPMHGLIHFLLILALIVVIVDRVGREA